MKNRFLRTTALITTISMLLSASPVHADTSSEQYNPSDPQTYQYELDDNNFDISSNPDEGGESSSETVQLPDQPISDESDSSTDSAATDENSQDSLSVNTSSGDSMEDTTNPDSNPLESQETEIELQVEESFTADDSIDSDELLQGYLDQCFHADRGISLFRSFNCGELLSGQSKKMYSLLTPLLKTVAAGTQPSTVFLLESTDVMEKVQFTKEELGVTAVTEENARTLAATRISYDARLILEAILNDMPYELFWFNKQNGGMKITYTLGYTSNYVRIKQFKVSFTVSDEYKGADVYTVDTNKLESINKAVENAKSVILEAAELADLKKIEFYKNRICEFTEYNYTAAASTYTGGYGNPWQLIYVFDGNPATKVVCEGYAKAFQYLMDETAFSSWDIYSILVSGTKSGGKHMWNIVHMEDNRNYLVDITATDSYFASAPTHRFMEIPNDGDPEKGYTYSSKNMNGVFINGSVYKYDVDTLNLYSREDLTLSDTEYGKKPEPKLLFRDNSGDEKQITILTKNVQNVNRSEDILVAVWSRENGQDDLKWYTMQYSASEKAYIADVSITEHKSTGIYDAHLYHRDSSNNMTLLAKNTFEIHPVQADNLSVDMNAEKSGSAIVTISGVSCPSGVTRVQFPIWSKSDQSDIVWYEGKKIAEGVYQINLDIAKHGFHTGTYHIHTYGTNGIGARNFLLNTSCVMKGSDPSVRVIRNSSDYSLVTTGLNNGDVKEIRIAVWSGRNGQDDLIWYNFKPSAPGSGTINWKPKEYGLHYIHCYIVSNAGKLIFQKGIEETVPTPSIETIAATTGQSSGAFTVNVTGLHSLLGISKVQIAIWNDAKQKDLIWYTASKKGDGSYAVESNISKHGFRTGTYFAHLYVTDGTGKMQFTGNTEFSINCSLELLEAAYSSNSKSCSLLAKGLDLPFAVDKMSFAVWSEKDGQDDLRWYDASVKSGQAATSLSIANHKNTAGIYHVHLYAVTKTGSYVFVGNTTFLV